LLKIIGIKKPSAFCAKKFSATDEIFKKFPSVEGWHFAPKAQNDGVVVRTGDEKNVALKPASEGLVFKPPSAFGCHPL
jgi:hypothetical protein